MNKVALLVVYNHRYDKNIPRINEIYKNSFSYIYHLMPFYDGDEKNVIPVYDSSYYFHSFISQAYTHLKNQGYTHYFVISDDLILNPAINETNLWDITGLPADYCMLPGLIEFQNCRVKKWSRIKDAIEYDYVQRGLEISNILPSKQEAINSFKFHGISVEPIEKETYKHLYLWKKICKFSIYKKNVPKNISLSYPLVGGYSDICLVTADCMQNFCSYCGAFAAGNLFVEVSLPTAMVLSTRKLAFIRDLKLINGDMWSSSEKEIVLRKYNNILANLLSDFPSDKMFLHPIKLSAFK